jgi:tetratricopeptide (TPR) repeat protein
VDSLVTTFRLLGLSGRLDEALELRRDLFGALEQAAIELYRSQDFELAAEYFEKVLDYGGRLVRPLLYYARCLAHLGRGPEAHAIVDEAEDLSPADPWVIRVRGRVDFTLGAVDSAIASYERSFAMRPTSRQVRTDLAQAYVLKEEWARASEHLEPLLEDDPSAFALSLHSQVLEAAEQWDDAYEVMSAAVRLDPGNSLYHHRLGRIAEQRGDVDGAVREYASAIDLDSGRTESKLSLASILVDEQMVDQARAILSSIPDPSPKVRSVMYNIDARTHLASGNIAKARRAVQEALSYWRSRQNLGLACEVEIAAMTQGEIDLPLGVMRVKTYAEELAGFSPMYAQELVERAEQMNTLQS